MFVLDLRSTLNINTAVENQILFRDVARTPNLIDYQIWMGIGSIAAKQARKLENLITTSGCSAAW